MARQIADGLSQKATATTTEAENATAGKYPDAAGVHAAFNQYGIGPTFRALLGSLNSPLFNGMGYVPSSDPDTPSTQFSEAFEVLSFLDGNEQYGVQEATGQRSYRKFHRSKFAGAWQTWREVYKQNSILGTVSQSGGVPTGAIIERGSNANGEYVKYADGTMVCTTIERSSGTVDSAVGSVFNSALLGPYPQPATFFGEVHASYVSFSNETYWAGCLSHPSSSLYLRVYRATSTTNPVNFRVVTIGRWF